MLSQSTFRCLGSSFPLTKARRWPRKPADKPSRMGVRAFRDGSSENDKHSTTLPACPPRPPISCLGTLQPRGPGGLFLFYPMSEATIRRHVTADPFARVKRAMLEASDLSWKAKGILSYLLGKPDNWQLKEADLINRGNDTSGKRWSPGRLVSSAGTSGTSPTLLVTRTKSSRHRIGFPDAGFPTRKIRRLVRRRRVRMKKKKRRG